MKLPAYPRSKPSGVEWLGDVPEHWEVKRLRQVLSRNDGGVWGEEDDPEGTVVLRSTEQTVDGDWQISDPARRNLTPKEKSAALLKAGDLVVTKSSGSALHIGKTSLVSKEVETLQPCFSNFMQRLRVAPSFEPRLVFYVLNSPTGRQQLVFNSNTTTGLANLNAGVLGDVFISAPSPPEQRAIAAFLHRETGRIDALVAKKGELIERLKEKRSALISRTVTRGLPPAAAQAAGLPLNPPMKDSGIEWLGEIPGHWEVKRLSYLAMLRSGESINSEMIAEGGDYPVYGGNGFRGYYHRFTHRGHYALIGRQGALCGNINYASGEFWASEHALVVIPLTKFSVTWIGELLRTMNLGQYSVTAAQPGISAEMISGLRIPVPPLPEQHAIAAYLDEEAAKLDALVAKVEEAIERLQEYRSALITAAVTGKIDVRKEAGA